MEHLHTINSVQCMSIDSCFASSHPFNTAGNLYWCAQSILCSACLLIRVSPPATPLTQREIFIGAHNQFCVVHVCWFCDPSRKCFFIIIYSSPLIFLFLPRPLFFMSIEALCVCQQELWSFQKAVFLSVVLSFRLYLVILCTGEGCTAVHNIVHSLFLMALYWLDLCQLSCLWLHQVV